MEVIKDIPTNSVSPEVWKAGFMILGCVVILLLSLVYKYLRETLSEFRAEIKSLSTSTLLNTNNIVHLRDDVVEIKEKLNNYPVKYDR